MRKIKFAQLVRYTIVGTFASFCDFMLLWLLLSTTPLHYLLAAGIAFCAATLLHYTINRKFNYKTTKRIFSVGAGYFFTVNVAGLILTLVLIAFFVEIINIPPLLARVIALPFVGLVSYILNTKITFQGHVFK